jgi:RNA-directed DNA polymerase
VLAVGVSRREGARKNFPSRVAAAPYRSPAWPTSTEPEFFCRRSTVSDCPDRAQNVLPKRFAEYGLTLHPEKTRLVEFGRNAEGSAKRQGKKPGNFDFLGLTHICARSRRGKYTVHVRTMRKRLCRSLTAVAQWCQEHRHEKVGQQQKTLNAKLRGHYQYYGRSTNFRSISQFHRAVRQVWRKWLNRRTRGRWLTWEKYLDLLRRYPLLPPRIMHSWATPGSPA